MLYVSPFGGGKGLRVAVPQFTWGYISMDLGVDCVYSPLVIAEYFTMYSLCMTVV